MKRLCSQRLAKATAKVLIAASAVYPMGIGRAQTRIDLRTQATAAAEAIPASAKQGSGTKFQMSGPGSPKVGAIVVYDSSGNVLAGDCEIQSGALNCGDGSRLSTIELPELTANGRNAFVLHGAAEQAVDGCIVLSGQPEGGQVATATGTTITDDEGRTCAVMRWTAPGGIANLSEIPTRNYADLQNIPGTFPAAAHAASHRDGGTDEVAVAAPAANAIPKADASGTLASGWLPNPGASAKGGVRSMDCSATGAVGAINTDGSLTCVSTLSGIAGGDLSGTTANATVAKVNGVSYAASPVVNAVPVVTATGTTAYVPIPACPDDGGKHLNYDSTTHAFQCGSTSNGGTAARVNFWRSPNATDRNGSIGLGGSGQMRGTGIHISYPLSVSKILVSVQTADALPCSNGSNCYSIALFSAADGRRVASTGTTSMNTAGLLELPFAQGTVTIDPGWYLVTFTGTATAAKIAMSTSTYVIPTQWANAYLGNSSGGLVPDSVTVPAVSSWGAAGMVYAAMY